VDNGEGNLWQSLSSGKYGHWKVIDDQLALIPSPQVPLGGLINQVETCTLETQGVFPMGISPYSKFLTISEMGSIWGKTLPAIPAIKI